ncbi:MAG: TMEM175 family protein [Acidobacteriaceae bacterium]
MSKPLSSDRLEAFSDGVIAVIITIMVLELHVPAKNVSNLDGLRALTPLLTVYLLSFVQTGIYWVNHHYLTDDIDTVTHGILWSNLAFLFFLSLFPFATRWVAERGISSFSIALYAVASILPAIAWIVLSTTICRRTGEPLAGSPLKQLTSSALYLGAIPAAFVSPYLALAMIATVAILWLMPPKKIIERTRASHP